MKSTGLGLIILSLVIVSLVTNCGTPPVPTTVPPTAIPQPPTSAPPTSAPTIAPAAPTKAPTSVVSAPTAPPAKGVSISITWYGQSTFVISTSTGLKALLDPTGTSTGYKIPTQEGIDVVTTSHEHGDHNAVALASGSPVVIKGLSGNDWAKIDQSVKNVKIRTVGTYHDDKQGSQRGKNAIFIFDIDGLRAAHMGDLGHALSPEQIKEIGPLDIIMIPVGGYYTIDAKTAVEVIGQINPKVVIPMHVKTVDVAANLASVLAPVDDFVKAIGDKATVTESSQTVTIEKDKLPTKLTVLVLKYK